MCGPEGDHSHQDAGSSPRLSQFDSSQRKPRTLVLCFDGTSDSFDETPTNIIRLSAALEKGRPNEQLVYYQPGIGTYARPEAPGVGSIRSAAKMIDQAFAWYLGIHITGGYKFIMQHYNEGDRICLFGFSRGAFTAHCLAGMLHKVGLLPRSNSEHVDFAYTLYEKTDSESIKRAQEFRKTFSVQIEVEFIGVCFRHALAIDECRTKFQPNPWQYRKQCECGAGGRTQTDGSKTIDDLNGSQHATCEENSNSLCWCKDDEKYHGGRLTNVREVWFPGCHADVGGGNEGNHVTQTLANPSLRWMVTEILKASAGVIFNEGAFEDRLSRLAEKLKRFQNRSAPPTSSIVAKPHHHVYHASETTAVNGDPVMPPATPGSSRLEKPHEGMTEAHHDEEIQEAKNGKSNSMLEQKPLWKILEWLPLTQTWIDTHGREVEGRRGRKRTIDHAKPLFHKSVQHRLGVLQPIGKMKPYDPLPQLRYPDGLKYIHEDQELSEDESDHPHDRSLNHGPLSCVPVELA